MYKYSILYQIDIGMNMPVSRRWEFLLILEFDYFSSPGSTWPLGHGRRTIKHRFILKILIWMAVEGGGVCLWQVFGTLWGVLLFCSVLTTAGIATGRNQLSRCKPQWGGERSGRAM